MRAARGRAVGGPWEGRAGGSLAMAPTPSPKCHLPLAPDGGKPDFSVQGAGAAWSSTPCRVAPSGAGSTAHRGLGRTRPSAARARAGGRRSQSAAAPGRLGVNACAVHGQSTASVLRPSERAPSPHRRQRAAEAAGWLWSGRRRRCWLRGRGADEAASYRSAVRQCRSVSTRRVRRSRVGATRRSPAAAEGFAWLGQRWPSRRGVENLESQDMRPSWSPRCSRMRVKPAAERTQPP